MCDQFNYLYIAKKSRKILNVLEINLNNLKKVYLNYFDYFDNLSVNYYFDKLI